MDSTLIEFTDMKWKRGDIAFLFNGEKKSELVQTSTSVMYFLCIQSQAYAKENIST